MCGPIFEVSAGISTVEKVAERQDYGLWEHQGAEVRSMACFCLVWMGKWHVWQTQDIKLER